MMNAESSSKTRVTFLGTEAVVPSCGGDSASFVLNGKYLIDTGWYAALRMGCYGLNPLDLDYLFLTHGHHDHYLGLPHLLFSLAMRVSERPAREPLKIVGPAEDLKRIVHLTQQFLQMEHFAPVHYEPELIPLMPGESMENAHFALETCASVHPVPGLCYRFTDKHTQKVVAFTGDTAYNPAIMRHVQGAHLLIHEASYGAAPAPPQNASLHSGAPDAARVAREAGVQWLALVHCPLAKQQEALQAAQSLFPNTLWPADGETFLVE